MNEAREWFQLTHGLHGGPGWVEWQRTSLPAAGGVEDQPAKLMEALALLAREENALIRRAAKQRRAPGEKKRTPRG